MPSLNISQTPSLLDKRNALHTLDVSSTIAYPCDDLVSLTIGIAPKSPFRDWDAELIWCFSCLQISGMGFSTLMALPNHVRWIAQVETRASPVNVRMRYRFTWQALARIPSDLHLCCSVITAVLPRAVMSMYICIVIQYFYSNIGCLAGMTSEGTLLDLIEAGRLLNLFHSQLRWSSYLIHILGSAASYFIKVPILLCS